MNFITDLCQLNLIDVYNNGKTVKQYTWEKTLCICQNNYIKTNSVLVGILVKNEAMKCKILKCILNCIINNCKPHQNFECPETELSCRFTWFGHLVSMGLVVSLNWRMWLIVYLLFYSVLLYYFSIAGSSKSIQKTSICSNKNTQKKLNNIT